MLGILQSKCACMHARARACVLCAHACLRPNHRCPSLRIHTYTSCSATHVYSEVIFVLHLDKSPDLMATLSLATSWCLFGVKFAKVSSLPLQAQAFHCMCHAGCSVQVPELVRLWKAREKHKDKCSALQALKRTADGIDGTPWLLPA